VSTHEQPASAYTGAEHENDPGGGAAIAKEAPAEPGTLSSAADEREPAAREASARGASAGASSEAPVVPGADAGDQGLPSGSTDTPPADTGGRRDGTDADAPLHSGLSGRAGSDPDKWPAGGRAGVSGRAPGEADLENPGGTGLTTTDTEGGEH
jgi:hypothetical protein